ncbi:MAG: RHS repeat protein, partial [Proteobacteria bacterium]|nr:RHS repeat protein [Pseudomonadota bacterium]
MGNPLEERDFNGNIHKTDYNALNLPWRVYDPAPFNGARTETSYYKTGKVREVKNRLGRATTYEIDALGRVIRVTDALGQTIETTYDHVGNVKSVKDKRGITTHNFYDALNRLIRTTRAGVRLVTDVYDAEGNLTEKIDPENRTFLYEYDALNRLTTQIFPTTGSPYRETTRIAPQYDANNNVKKITEFKTGDGPAADVTINTHEGSHFRSSQPLKGSKAAQEP